MLLLVVNMAVAGVGAYFVYSALDADANHTDAQIQSLQTQTQAQLSSQLQSLQSLQTQVQTEITTIQQYQQQVSASSSGTTQQFANITSQLQSLQTLTQTQLQSQLQSLQSLQSQTQAEIATIQQYQQTVGSFNNATIQTFASTVAQLQAQISQLNQSNAQLSSQTTQLQGQVTSLTQQLTNATALLTLLRGPTGILPTSSRLTWHADGYSDFELSLQNTGDVNISQIFINLDAIQLPMQFFFLNMTVSPQSPLPPYQIATGEYFHIPLTGGKGTYTLIISAVAVNGSVYSYQTTVSNL